MVSPVTIQTPGVYSKKFCAREVTQLVTLYRTSAAAPQEGSLNPLTSALIPTAKQLINSMQQINMSQPGGIRHAVDFQAYG